jgi:uncharacterized membrane protein
MVLAAAVCVVGLGSKNMWVDEGTTIGLVRAPFDDFLHSVVNWEVNQSAYYVVVRAWSVLGDDLGTLRLVSVLFTVATVPVMYLLGTRLHGEAVGIAAALVLALHGMVLQYSQMLRSYSMVLFLVTLATWALLERWTGGRPGRRSCSPSWPRSRCTPTSSPSWSSAPTPPPSSCCAPSPAASSSRPGP